MAADPGSGQVPGASATVTLTWPAGTWAGCQPSRDCRFQARPSTSTLVISSSLALATAHWRHSPGLGSFGLHEQGPAVGGRRHVPERSGQPCGDGGRIPGGVGGAQRAVQARGRLAAQGGGEGAGHHLMLGVGLRVRRALDALGGIGDIQRLVPGDLDERIVERIAGVVRVHHLRRGAPALGRPLLEQPAGVGTGLVAMADVAQFGFLHGGGQRDAGGPGRKSPPDRDGGDEGSVGRLVGGEVIACRCPWPCSVR